MSKFMKYLTEDYINEDAQHKIKCKKFAKTKDEKELKEMYQEYMDAGRISKTVSFEDWKGYMSVESKLYGYMK